MRESKRVNRFQTGAHRFRRSRRGGAVVEAAGSMAILVPVIVFCVFVVVQVSEYFVLKQDLAYVARRAAKEIADAYSQGEQVNDPQLTGMNSGYPAAGAGNSGNANYAQILNSISVPGVINANSAAQFRTQFTAKNPNPQFVYVYVQYQNGANLPSFPWSPIGNAFIGFSLPAGALGSACVWCVPH